MRSAFFPALLVLVLPVAAIAQTPSPPAAAPPDAGAKLPRGGNITRDEYIDRAKRNAANRFDRMDANHDGILTPEERRAFRAQRSSQPR